MTPVRVLQVLTCDGLGGTEHMVATMVERIDRRQVLPTVVTLDRPGPIAHRLAGRGIPVRSLGAYGLPAAFARLAGVLRREPFEVVNAYGFKSTFVARFLVRALARRSVFVSGVRGLHMSELERLDGPKARLVLRLERLTSRLVDVYDANSRGAVELLAKTGIDRRRLRYIPNGLDVERWSPDSAGRAGSMPVVLCVARFVPRKRHQDLLSAAAILRDRGVRVQLQLIGDGPTLPDMRRLVGDLGLDELVCFAGARDPDQVREAMCRVDVFCLASRWEGMAGSVMEAMACGLPVVGTHVNGIADLVEHSRTGYLVPAERPDLLAAALQRLIMDPGERATLGAAGRNRICKEFSVERMVAAKEELYVGLVAGG
jgi:glycosyltransferase involved in cell wall biosynthesis